MIAIDTTPAFARLSEQSMEFPMRIAQCASILLLGFAATLYAQTSVSAASTTTASPTVAYVYVGQNTSPEKVSAFAVSSNGVLSTVSGSPFAARSQSLAVTSGYLFGTDGTYITTYARGSNGALHAASTISAIAHNDTPTGSGAGSLTLDHTGSTLYAAEFEFQGADNDAYAAFSVGSGGLLKFQSNSAISVDYSSELQFSPNNLFAYSSGCYFAGWELNAFRRAASGQIAAFNPAAAMPSNPNGDLLCPVATAVSAKGYLAVLYFDESTSPIRPDIAIYRIVSSGDLVLVSSAVEANNLQAMNPDALRFDPTGAYLVVAGTGIDYFLLNSNGTLARIGDALDSSIKFTDVRWDKAGHLYAISAASLHVFTSHNMGGLTQTATRPLTNATSLAVLPVH
jgi:hypothetical protein